MFAARFREEWISGDEVRERDCLVVVDAESPAHAQMVSGLTYETFVPATERDLDEWDDIVDQPLARREVEAVLSMVRKAQRQVGKRRLRDREPSVDAVSGVELPPRWNPAGNIESDSNRARARLLTEIAGKIEAMGADD